MHAQTNLQLYKQLIHLGWSNGDLAEIREAYDLARELFAPSYRPSHKSFTAHLVGVASALAAWGEPKEQVIGGLLHSTYLYGDFGDNRRGVTPHKRSLVRKRVGDAVEERIYSYTLNDGKPMCRDDGSEQDRNAQIIGLADIYDEFADGGPYYSPDKSLPGELTYNGEGQEQTISLAEKLIGSAGVTSFQVLFSAHSNLQIPGILTTPDRSFHTLRKGVVGYHWQQARFAIDWLASVVKRVIP